MIVAEGLTKYFGERLAVHEASFEIPDGAVVGFLLALIILAGVRERFVITRIPRCMQGTAIGLIMAGLMSLSFFAFTKMI